MVDNMFFENKPVIGVIHLPPLPGSPAYNGTKLQDIIKRALNDAEKYVENSVDAIIIENYCDAPFSVRVTEPETLASLAIISWEIKKRYRIPIGLNILRNSGVEATAIACILGLDFIRVNSLVEHVLAPEGVLSPIARDLFKKKSCLRCNLKIFADINVKHGVPLYPLETAIRETEERGKADAIIVTGERTGEAPDPPIVYYVKKVSKKPVIIGSGVNVENVKLYFRLTDGFIVGTYFKKQGVAANPVDPNRVKKFMDVVKDLRRKYSKV